MTGARPGPRRRLPMQAPDDGALRARLHEGVTALGIALDERQSERLLRFVALLSRWNTVYNLTAIRDPQRMVAAHLLDCLAPLPELQGVLEGCAGVPSLLDVGSGAGLPGIVWAIMLDREGQPRARVALVDAIEKKTAFQRQACAELGLRDVQCVHARVEHWQGGPFDVICSRAYASLSDFVGGTAHLLARGGRWLALKGASPQAEIADLPAGVEVERVAPLIVPQLDEAARCLVLMRSGIMQPVPADVASADRHDGPDARATP